MVGRAIGDALAQEHAVTYAGRRDADLFLDLNSPAPALPDSPHFDVVIHAAAAFKSAHEEDLLQTELVNAIGTLNVCRLARKVQAQHIVYISSISVKYESGDPYFSIYSLSKRHGEELALLHCKQYAIPLTILRPTIIYDAELQCRKSHSMLYMIIQHAAQNKDTVFYGKNNPERNYIYIDDVAEIVRRVVEDKITGTYDCPHEDITLSALAKTAYEVFGTEGAILFDPDKPSIPDITTPNDYGLYSIIGYRPRISIREGISRIQQAGGIL